MSSTGNYRGLCRCVKMLYILVSFGSVHFSNYQSLALSIRVLSISLLLPPLLNAFYKGHINLSKMRREHVLLDNRCSLFDQV